MREKTCLVIGGGRGMGAATAREMHKRGYRLSLMSPSESCEQLAKDLKAVALRGKAENKENLKSIVSFTMEKYGRIDSVLVHVGGPPKGDLLEIDDGDWDKANQMIIKPVISIAKLVTPIMLEQGGGSIVNITTFSAFEQRKTAFFRFYECPGVSSFTKLFSERYGAKNIRMNCLLPGFTDSLNLPDEFAQLSSLKRLARAEEQAKVAAFLLSDDSSYITGQSIRSDGGVTRHM